MKSETFPSSESAGKSLGTPLFATLNILPFGLRNAVTISSALVDGSSDFVSVTVPVAKAPTAVTEKSMTKHKAREKNL